MAFSWSEGMYVISSGSTCKLVYKDTTGTPGKITNRTSNFSPDGAGNVGGSFKFPVLIDFNKVTVINSASGTIYLFKIGRVPMIGLRASYGHQTLGVGSPSVSFPAGASISFGSNVDEIATSLKYWYLK